MPPKPRGIRSRTCTTKSAHPLNRERDDSYRFAREFRLKDGYEQTSLVDLPTSGTSKFSEIGDLMIIPIPIRVRQWRCPHCDHVLNSRINFWPLRSRTFNCPKCKQTINCNREIVIYSWRMATIVRSLFVFWMLLIAYVLILCLLFPRRMEKGIVLVPIVFGWMPSVIPAIISGWTYGVYLGRSQADRLNLPQE
jgi:hypothetical protein